MSYITQQSQQKKFWRSPFEGLDAQCGMSVEAGEGMLVGTARESFTWKVGFELDLLKAGTKIWEAGAAPLGTGALSRWWEKQGVERKRPSW